LQVRIAKIAESYNPAHGQSRKKNHSGEKGKSRRFEWFFTPVLGPFLLNRWLIGIFLGAGLSQLILVAAGLNGWQCPINATAGITCPGCGLTTAMTLLATGRWATAVETHAFAPIFFGVLVLMMAAIVSPRPVLKKISTRVAVLERKTGLTAIITLGMVLYWLLRVFIF
jgi:hypothetical protein